MPSTLYRAEEKRIFTAQFFRRVIPFDSCPLDDEKPLMRRMRSLPSWMQRN